MSANLSPYDAAVMSSHPGVHHHSRSHCTTSRLRFVMAALAVLVLISVDATVSAQTIRITGDRLSGVVLPVEPVAGDIALTARRARAWRVDDTQRIVLEGDVRIRIGTFDFSSQRAAVWINRLPSADGIISQMAVYFDEVSNPAAVAGLGATGERVLVTGSVRGAVVLEVASMQQERPAPTAFVRRAEDRLAGHIRSILAEPPRLARYPQTDIPPRREPFVPQPGGLAPEPTLPAEIDLPPAWQDTVAGVPLFIPEGTINFNAGRIELLTGEDENVVVATVSFIVEYLDDRGEADFARLSLSAQRGVVFTEPGALRELASQNLDASSVRGIYLEGNVIATDGSYTLRGQHVYYDMARQQAIVLDGVLRTHVRGLANPVYARAAEIRQLSQNQWEARRAVVSTSEFFTPHIAVGASRVTVTRESGGEGEPTETYIDARNTTLRLGDLPVFWLPRVAGRPADTPLRSVGLRSNDEDGVRITTRWDLFSLFGRSQPDGVDAELRVDGYSKRGVGLGIDLDYDISNVRGALDLYGMYDKGRDRTSAGVRLDPDETYRGVALWEQNLRLDPGTLLQTQVSWISDPTYITSFREDDFRQRREYETSAYLRHVNDHTALTILSTYHLFDFIANEDLIASRQYRTERMPEVAYRRIGDSLFSNTVTYSSEYSFARVRFRTDSTTPRELGLRRNTFAGAFDEPFDDVLFDRGLRTSFVNRFDTRHELSLPLSLGMFHLTPFGVLRWTAWDDDFHEFSGENDKQRIFAAAGLRLSTEFHRINNAIHSSVFDINRTRHIVEPSLTLWHGYSEIDRSRLPVFDQRVESLADGTAARIGLKNTWQTQRGGPGRWRSVDFLVIDGALVLTSGETDLQYPVPQFFEHRPEYSNLGDHLEGSFIWLASDTLSFLGESIYDLDADRVARASIGAELQHTPLFTTFVEYRYVNASDLQLLDIGWNYRLTMKYRLGLSPQWDLREDDFRALRVVLTRSFPNFDFVVGVRYDRIRDETTFTASLGRVNF